VPPAIHVVKDQPLPLAPPKLRIPEPVEDWSVLVSQFPTAIQITAAAFDEMGRIDQAVRGDLHVVPHEAPLPTSDQIVIVEVYSQLLRMEAPLYPPLAREAGVEGTVLLRVLVSKEGKVLNVIVLSGNPMLADAARTAAFTARFTPAQQQHKPVPVWVQLPVVFSLN
jgi:TonB family protein